MCWILETGNITVSHTALCKSRSRPWKMSNILLIWNIVKGKICTFENQYLTKFSLLNEVQHLLRPKRVLQSCHMGRSWITNQQFHSQAFALLIIQMEFAYEDTRRGQGQLVWDFPLLSGIPKRELASCRPPGQGYDLGFKEPEEKPEWGRPLAFPSLCLACLLGRCLVTVPMTRWRGCAVPHADCGMAISSW